MKKTVFPLVCLVVLVASSCISTQTVSVDYLKPAVLNFPEEIKKVAIVNNMPVDTSWQYIAVKSAPNVQIISHTTGKVQGNGNACAEKLAENIANQNYFDEVIICDSALRINDLFARETKLSGEEVKELSASLDVDMLVSVENVSIFTHRQLGYITDWNAYHTFVDAKVQTLVRIYLPNRSEPMVSLAPKDSIFWEAYGANEAIARKDIITDSQVLQEASEFAATMPMNLLLPSWKTVERTFYISGSIEFRDAAVCVKESSWDEALTLWEKAYKKKSERSKMHAATNIALYYEMNDQFEKAIEWIDKALAISKKKVKTIYTQDAEANLHLDRDYSLINLYRTDLETRKEELQLLKLQMNRFSYDF